MSPTSAARQVAPAWTADRSARDLYVCPDCRGSLSDWQCTRCGRQYETSRGIPLLLPGDGRYRVSARIAATYDDIYVRHTDVWEDQGRSTAVVTYLADVLSRYAPAAFLEIGCGEGALLARVPAAHPHGVDLSVEALGRAQARTPAALSVALAERLPFDEGTFDLVATVGVMEHFIDDRVACTEIQRVLRPGGHYVNLLHVTLTPWERVRQKTAQYLFPRFRPMALARWVGGKLSRPIHQPIQNAYTRQTALICLEQAGLRVTRVISTDSTPEAPLLGGHVLVYVCEKPALSP